MVRLWPRNQTYTVASAPTRHIPLHLLQPRDRLGFYAEIRDFLGHSVLNVKLRKLEIIFVNVLTVLLLEKVEDR